LKFEFLFDTFRLAPARHILEKIPLERLKTMTDDIGSKVFVDVQIGGEIKSWELLQDLCENIRMYFYLDDPAFDGPDGIKLMAQQVNGNAGYNESIHIQGLINRDSLFSAKTSTRYVVEGLDEGNMYRTDAEGAPFRIFDIETQDWLPTPFEVRAIAQLSCDQLNKTAAKMTHTAMSDLHAVCVMGNLPYQILEANPEQEGYNTMITWEPGTDWDDKQQFVDLVGEMEPGISLGDLRKAQKEGNTLEDITAKLGKVTTVALRHNRIKMDESIYLELRDALDREQSSSLKI
jgi:hypothetical protein